jgi:hypothetical protein
MHPLSQPFTIAGTSPEPHESGASARVTRVRDICLGDADHALLEIPSRSTRVYTRANAFVAELPETMFADARYLT